MSKFAEIITIKTMTGTLLLNGEPSPGVQSRAMRQMPKD
jgi:hypothetical protein